MINAQAHYKPREKVHHGLSSNIQSIAVCTDGNVRINVIECNGALVVQETIEDTYIDQNKRKVHVIDGSIS